MSRYYTRVCNFYYGSKSKSLVKENIIEREDANKIEDLNYSSTDEHGNIYKIFSKTGIIDKEDINVLKEKYPSHEIVISAQHRLEEFYKDLGFISRGEVYLEDDIDHIQMYTPPNRWFFLDIKYY